MLVWGGVIDAWLSGRRHALAGVKGGVNLPADAAAALPSADQYSAKSEERAFLRREVS